MKNKVKLFAKDKEKAHKQGSKHLKNKFKLSDEENIKLYESMVYKVYELNELICKYDTVGDRFYIILQGRVSVSQPIEIDLSFNTVWDVY